MRRSNVLLVVVLALLAVGALLVATDPLGLLGGEVAREGGGGAAESLGGRGPTLAGSERGPRAALPASVDGEPVGVLTLTLGKGALRGSVTGAGQPLALARVEPVLPPPHRAAVRTDEAGRYEIRGLPEGVLDLRAGAEGFRSRSVTTPALVAGAATEVPPIDLARRPDLVDGIEVKVTDLAGRPVEGARVLATTLPWDLHLAIGPADAGIRDAIHRQASSDARGVAQILGLPPQAYSVAVTAPGFCTLAWDEVQVAHGRVERLLARLGPAATIQGRVVDASGSPVPGARVMGFHQPSFMSSVMVTADKDGTFTLEGLREGRYWLMGFHDDAGRGQANPVTSPSQGALLKLGGTGTVEGRVLGTDGQPVKGATVRPYSSEPFGYVYSRVVRAQDDGTFRVGLTPGAWLLDAWSEGGQLAQGTKVSVKVGETSTVAITLPATGVVRGVVTDAAGEHVQGAEVYVRMGGFPPGPKREQYARSDADGAFEVRGLPLEPVKLHVRHPQHADTTWEGSPRLAAEAAPVTIRLGRGARIVGHVRGPGGRPRPGEQVNLFQNWFEPKTTFTDAEGTFAYEAVAAGTWQMSTGVFENGAPGEVKQGLKAVDGETLVVDFDSGAEGTGTLTGTVRVSGAPAQGAMVRVQDPSSSGAEVSTTTDAAGAFTLEGVPLGNARVYVETLDGNSLVRFVEVDAESRTGRLDVSLGTSRVRGRVLGSNGQPVAGAWVTVEITSTGAGDVWSRTKAQKTTTTEGTWEARGLEAGTYVLRVNGGEHAQHLGEPWTLAEGESRDLGDVRLLAGASLSGRVTNDQGAPVEDATVSLQDAQGRPVFNFSLSTTGSDGRYTVHGLLPGTYTVRFEARGLSPDERPATVTAAGGTVDGVLTRGGALSVLAEDAAGRPVAGGRVVLTNARGETVQRTLSLVNLFDGEGRTTDAEGRVTVSDLAAGAYRVSVQKDGYEADGEPAAASVTAGGTTAVRVRLRAVEAPR